MEPNCPEPSEYTILAHAPYHLIERDQIVSITKALTKYQI